MQASQPFGRRRLRADPAVRSTADHARALVSRDRAEACAQRTHHLRFYGAMVMGMLLLAPVLDAGVRSMLDSRDAYDSMSPEDLARLEPTAGAPMGALAKLTAALNR